MTAVLLSPTRVVSSSSPSPAASSSPSLSLSPRHERHVVHTLLRRTYTTIFSVWMMLMCVAVWSSTCMLGVTSPTSHLVAAAAASPSTAPATSTSTSSSGTAAKASGGGSSGQPKPKHIMLVSLSLRGHVVPLMRLSTELQQRGYRVSFAVQDEGRDYAQQAGMTFVSLGRLPTSRHDRNSKLRQVSQETYFFRSVLTLLNAVYLPCSPIIFNALAAAVTRDRPDLIVVDAGAALLGGIDVAEVYGVPVVVNNPSLLSNIAQHGGGWMGGDGNHGSTAIPAWGSGFGRHTMTLWDRVMSLLYPRLLSIALTPVLLELNQLRLQRGLPLYTSLSSLLADVFIITNTAFGLEYPQPLSPLVRLTGPIMPSALAHRDSSGAGGGSSTSGSGDLPASLQTWLNKKNAKPVVLVLTGAGAMSYLENWQVRELAVALDNAGTHRVLWALRSEQHMIVRGLPGASFRLKSNFPQLPVLVHPAVRVVISPCGLGTAQEALYFGKPLLCLPVFGDQADVAARVVDAGAGFTLDKTGNLFEADEIRRLVDALLSDAAFAHNAKRVGTYLRSQGGVYAAADAVEFALHTGTAHLVGSGGGPRLDSDGVRIGSGGGDENHAARQFRVFALLFVVCACLLVVARSAGIVFADLCWVFMAKFLRVSFETKADGESVGKAGAGAGKRAATGAAAKTAASASGGKSAGGKTAAAASASGLATIVAGGTEQAGAATTGSAASSDASGAANDHGSGENGGGKNGLTRRVGKGSSGGGK